MSASLDAPSGPLEREELRLIDAWWRAANYLSVGQIYLLGNALLREPLAPEHVKPRLLGHWGTTPGLNLIYAHLNRLIVERDLNVLYVTGPGHGGPGIVANAYLEGTYSELYAQVSRDEAGLQQSLPPVLVPGRHPEPRRARDARLDPRGRRARLRAGARLRRGLRQPRSAGRLRDRRRRGGDRAAGDELARRTSSSTRQRRRRAADPAPQRLQDREPDGARAHPGARAASLLEGYGWRPLFVGRRRRSRARAPAMAATLDEAFDEIAAHPGAPRGGRRPSGPRWPMIVLRTPKGWTGPKIVDGLPVEGTWRSHQVPLADVRANAGTCALLENWMRSYRPGRALRRVGRAARRDRGARARAASGG